MRFNLSNPLEASKAKVYLASLIKDCAKSVEITNKRKRTLSQNALFHVWIRCFADFIGETDIDYCRVSVVRAILGQKVKSNKFTNRTEYYDYRTSEMSTEQMTLLLDKFHAWAQTEYNLHLPLPEENGYDDMYNAYVE